MPTRSKAQQKAQRGRYAPTSGGACGHGGRCRRVSDRFGRFGNRRGHRWLGLGVVRRQPYTRARAVAQVVNVREPKSLERRISAAIGQKNADGDSHVLRAPDNNAVRGGSFMHRLGRGDDHCVQQ